MNAVFRRGGTLAAVALLLASCTAQRVARPGIPTPTESPSATESSSTPAPSPPKRSEPILAIALVSPTRGWVLTAKHLLHTIDGGRTWGRIAIAVPTTDPVYPYPTGEFFVDGDTAWVARVGRSLTITEVSGHALRVRSSVIANLGPGIIQSAALSFLNANDGYVSVAHAPDVNSSVSSSDLYRTHDGGVTWTLVARKTPVTGSIHFASASVGWAMQDRLLRTIDGGRTWHEQSVPISFVPELGLSFNALSMFGADGVVEALVPTGNLGYPAYAVTDDGGRTWIALERQPTAEAEMSYSPTGPPFSFSAVDALHWRVSDFDRISATDDGGLHWKLIASSSTFHTIEGLSFATVGVGWMFAYPDELACWPSHSCGAVLEGTADGGRTWHLVSLPV